MSEIQYILVEKIWLEEISSPATIEVNYVPPAEADDAWHYQLYINGIFSDISENSTQRSFAVHEQEFPQIFSIIAVEPAGRTTDLSFALSEEIRNPPWVCRFRMTQDTAFEPGDIIEIYHDNGTGEMSDTPSLRWQVWPPAISHPGWGNATLSDSGFGIDGSNAPGMSAPFGIGPMGLGGYELQAVLPLCKSGEHNLLVLSRSRDNTTSQSQEFTFNCSPPSPRAGELTFTGHNIYNKIANLRIN